MSLLSCGLCRLRRLGADQQKQLLANWAAALCRLGIAWISVGAGSVSYGETKLIEAFAGNSRPPDFYSIVSDGDSSVCRPVLRSLNKEFRIEDDKIDATPRASVESDLLLASDLQVRWNRKLVRQSDQGPDELSSLDVVQVQLEGRTISVLRRGLMKAIVEVGATLPTNRLWISAAPPPILPSGRRLTLDEVARVDGEEVHIDVSAVKSMDSRPNLVLKPGGASARPGLFNLVSVKGHLYLLVVDAVEAATATQRTLEGTIDLYVLRFVSEKEIHAVCHFRSN